MKMMMANGQEINAQVVATYLLQATMPEMVLIQGELLKHGIEFQIGLAQLMIEEPNGKN